MFYFIFGLSQAIAWVLFLANVSDLIFIAGRDNFKKNN